jgi:hypothetical protein
VDAHVHPAELSGYDRVPEDMDEDMQRPPTGAVVAYFDLSQYPVGAVRTATTSDTAVLDPGTSEQWVPVRRADGTVDLVPAALIIDVLPLED